MALKKELIVQKGLAINRSLHFSLNNYRTENCWRFDDIKKDAMISGKVYQILSLT
jgi:hypothetical protein